MYHHSVSVKCGWKWKCERSSGEKEGKAKDERKGNVLKRRKMKRVGDHQKSIIVMSRQTTGQELMMCSTETSDKFYLHRERQILSLLSLGPLWHPPASAAVSLSFLCASSFFSHSPSLFCLSFPLLSQLIGAYALMNADRSRPDMTRSPIIMLLYLWLLIEWV